MRALWQHWRWFAQRLRISERRWLWDRRWTSKAAQAWRAGELIRGEREWRADIPAEMLALPGRSLPAGTAAACESLHRIEGALVEPDFGYAILKPGHLIDSSLPFAELPRDFATMQFFGGIPRHRDLWRARRGMREVRCVECALSFRHPFDLNYYHFTIDIVTRLELLARHRPDARPTIIVSPTLAKQPFFKQAIARPQLARFEWLVQEEFFVEAGELFIAKPLNGGSPQGIEYYLKLLETNATQGDLKIFLDRSPERGRTAANRQVLLPLIEALGYTVVDADRLSLVEQAELFGRCTHLAATHGAGLTNMIFRLGRPLKVMEIFPPSETSLEYVILANRLGFRYDWARGTQPANASRPSRFSTDPTDVNITRRLANFVVDPTELERLLSD